ASLDRIDHGLGIHTGPSHHYPAHRLLRAFDEGRDAEGVAELHGGNLLNEDGHPVRGTNHDALDVLHGLDQADTSNNGPRAVGFEHVAADVQVAASHRFDHLTER